MRAYLEALKDPYSTTFEFGNGPNWRMRTIRRALDLLGMNGDLIQHGLPREVFYSSVADNATKILRGINKRPKYSNLKTVEQVAELAKARWIVPRSERNPDYRTWRAESLKAELRTQSRAVPVAVSVERLANVKG